LLLPNHAKSRVPDAKLTGYLLAREHIDGGPKARFFERFGFSHLEPDQLRLALLAHAGANEVSASRKTDFGQIYEVNGRLNTPDGRNPFVLVAWMIEDGDDRPRLVTAVPSKG
jgi:hypothetical protein